MIHLSVEIDSSLLDWLRKAKAPHADFPARFETFQRENLLQLPKASFIDLPVEIEASEWNSMVYQADQLKAHLSESISRASQFCPDTTEEYHHHLKVVLLPYGKINYGPREGIQLYSVFPGTDWRETFLFLIHVYYHEITFLNYTERCREVCAQHESRENYLYYLQVLIQNEGIANYMVAKELERLIPSLGEDYVYRYFTYAREMRSEELIMKCMDVFNQLFAMGEENFYRYYKQISRLLKSDELPAINLIGLHMASSIARAFGDDVLRNVHKVPATEFFTLYMKTNDSLSHMLKNVVYASCLPAKDNASNP